jgi:hypothetical protein
VTDLTRLRQVVVNLLSKYVPTSFRNLPSL